MVTLPWAVAGARLNLPRDLEIAYAIGRMGAVTIADTYALWYGSAHTCRAGFGRLARLGLIRSFPRADPLAPAWFTLTRRGLEWAAEQVGCDERELRALESVRRVNLSALAMRNRLWASLILASRHLPSVRIGRFEPEWELRARTPEGQRLVPDAMLTLSARRPSGEPLAAWALEMDNATERSAVWKAKAEQYAAIGPDRRLYGIPGWRMLASVPTGRRALTVAAAITAGGAGAFSFVAVGPTLEAGDAFAPLLWPCLVLARTPNARPSASLVDGLVPPIDEADQRGRSAADRGIPRETGAVTP